MEIRAVGIGVLLSPFLFAAACAESNAEGESPAGEQAAGASGAYEDTSESRSLGLQPAGEFEEPPDAPFWAIASIAVSANSVYALDSRAGRVHRYDKSGRHEGSFGGEGQGPGELSAPMALGLVGDTLWVLNTQNVRIDYFSPDGEFLNSQGLPSGVFLSDAVAVGEDFVGTEVSGELPLVRFQRESTGESSGQDPTYFGEEIAAATEQYEADGEATGSPPVYRLSVIGEDLWVTNYFHPIAAVYDRSGNALQTIQYPDVGRYHDTAEGGSAGGEGEQQRTFAGSVFAFAHDDAVYLMSLQVDTDTDDRQWLYMLEGGTMEPVGRTSNTLGVTLGPMVADDEGTVYAVAIRPDTEESTVWILNDSDD